MVKAFVFLLSLLFSLIDTVNCPGFAPRADKSGSTFFGHKKTDIAQRNIVRYDWAKKELQQCLEAAEPWVKMTDDELWGLIPSAEIPRAIGVNRGHGCPNCGDRIYGDRGQSLYAFNAQPGQQWKVQCPACGEIFPKNDFEAFYKSGISVEDGLFHYNKADRSLLFNTEHPDPNDPLHRWCVDDGRGWVDKNGGLHLFVACSNYRAVWTRPMTAIRNLAKAHALTAKPEYAHKCLILLDRLADVFPNLNGRNGQLINFAPGAFWDGIIGPNYWVGGGWASLAVSYDMIYDCLDRLTDATGFIRKRADNYEVPSNKGSVEDIKRHIEHRLFIDRFGKRPSYQMNGTISEICEAKVDMVLRGRKAIDDFVKVHMPRITPERFLNPDGSGNERSIGYDQGAYSYYCQLLEELADLDIELAKKAVTDYPKFKAVFDFWPDIYCIDKYLPNIGDSGGGPGTLKGFPCPPGPYLKLFEITANPRYAQITLKAAGGDIAKLPRNIFGSDCEGVIKDAFKIYKESRDWRTENLVKKDYKLGILQSGESENGIALWLFYSPQAGTSSHSHFDALNFGLFAYGLSIVCEQGYPLFTGGWPSRWNWTSHTRSHATVTVDGICQKHCQGGRLLGFGRTDSVQMISAEAPCTYDTTSVYRRTLLLVRTSGNGHFILDVFRVKGGREHVYTVPVFYGEYSYKGLELSKKGQLYEGYVEDVYSAGATGAWFVDFAVRQHFKGEHCAYLRVHGTAFDGELMLGMGETRLGDKNPERIPYLFLKRVSESTNLFSTFVVLYEPYKAEPHLRDFGLSYRIGSDFSVVIDVETTAGQSFNFNVNDLHGQLTDVQIVQKTGDEIRKLRLSGISQKHN